MKITTTRFRDVRAEECGPCSYAPGCYDPKALVQWEQEFRGKPVRIFAKPVGHRPENATCEGPWWKAVDWMLRGHPVVFCAHTIEID